MKAGKAKNYAKRFFSFGAFAYLCTRKNENGTLTEWLGSGLQNRVQQFESARYLTNKSSSPHLESCSFSLQYAMASDYVRGGLDYVRDVLDYVA